MSVENEKKAADDLQNEDDEFVIRTHAKKTSYVNEKGGIRALFLWLAPITAAFGGARTDDIVCGHGCWNI